jgi:hypothetical protein
VPQYVSRLDELLAQKMELIVSLRAKLERFKEHLNQEENLARSIPPSTAKKLAHRQEAGGGDMRRGYH